jgi:FkbM family methyltransferase
MPPHKAVMLQVPGLDQATSLYIHGPEDQHVSRSIRQQGIWEPYETSLVLALLPPGGVFVDVGANIGYFSIVAARQVGERGQVYAFEPGSENFSLLQQSAELNGLGNRIHAVEAGLAAEGGRARLFLSENNLGDHQIFSTGEGRASTDIRLLNGSDYLGPELEQNDRVVVDLLKIDTQGSEYGVLEGLMPLLEGLLPPPTILLELTPLSLRQSGASGRALVELLSRLDQSMWIVDHVEHRLVPCPATELAQWCDDVDAVTGDAGFMNILVGNYGLIAKLPGAEENGP